MHLLNEKQFSSSEDEESEGESSADEPLEDSQIYDEENIATANTKQSNAEKHSEEETSEEDSEEDSEDEAHPYPTPPPDPDGNMLVQSVPNKENNSKLVKGTSQVRKGSILSQSLEAIKSMNHKSGSSVQAIVKFMKASGYKTTDETRLPKLVLKALKLALGKGEVVQVKRSFKLSNSKKESKATEKMKMKQKKKLAAEKDKAIMVSSKAEAKPKASTKKKATSSVDKTSNDRPKPPKKKPSERSTNQPAKEKINAAAVGGKARMKTQEDPAPVVDKESTKKMKKGKSTTKAPIISPKIEVKSNAPRRSIATLAPTSAKPKVNVKSIKKLVAGAGNLGGVVSVSMESEPVGTPTPSIPAKKKRAAKQVK